MERRMEAFVEGLILVRTRLLSLFPPRLRSLLLQVERVLDAENLNDVQFRVVQEPELGPVTDSSSHPQSTHPIPSRSVYTCELNSQGGANVFDFFCHRSVVRTNGSNFEIAIYVSLRLRSTNNQCYVD
ncbi:unnamed protein product [Fusarium venenatum]|uniref:Uncharacterized protein n=1 Tax=Fusarium venenatum TaxID=56646 RepID=A0A2L2T1D9_9HYPO|nr:uncharacterized protein FVRRES_00886 [Fusarium venenatum]CEI64374.1 unnamed protein product [Fusarium venenatum]